MWDIVFCWTVLDAVSCKFCKGSPCAFTFYKAFWLFWGDTRLLLLYLFTACSCWVSLFLYMQIIVTCFNIILLRTNYFIMCTCMYVWSTYNTIHNLILLNFCSEAWQVKLLSMVKSHPLFKDVEKTFSIHKMYRTVRRKSDQFEVKFS